MDLRNKITEALALHRNGPASDGRGWYRDATQEREFQNQADAVMGVVEGEQKHARADALYWAARQLRNTPITCTALTGPYWYGQGWKDAADHLLDLAEWDPSDGEAERTWLAARVRELEENNQKLRGVLEDVSCAGTLEEVSDALDKAARPDLTARARDIAKEKM